MKQLSRICSSRDDLRAFLTEETTRATVHAARSVLAQVYVGEYDEKWIRDILQALRQLSESIVVVGATTLGEICEGKGTARLTVISLCCFNHASLFAVHLPFKRGEESSAASKLVERLRTVPEPVKGVLLLSTPISVNCEALISSIYAKHPELPVYGGCAADFNQKHTPVFSGDGILDAGLVAVALSGETLEILRRTYLGWSPMGKRMRVTKSSGLVVHTIENEPAFKMYARYLGISSDENFFSNAMEFPFLIERHGELLARVPNMVDEDGGVHFVATINEGEDVQFGYANLDSILENVKATEAEVRNFAPEAINIYSCGIRHIFLQKDVELELAPFQAIASTAGFFTEGEFCHSERHSTLMNATLVIAAMREGPALPDTRAQPEKPSAPPFDIYRHNHTRILARFQHFMRAMTEDLEFANRELSELAERDSLTGLFNRRTLDSRLKHEIERSARYNRQLCVIAGDVDHFKQLNDTYGHPAGDVVLQTLANTITEDARAADTVCRYGGEEFVILLPESNLDVAMLCAERIRKHIEELVLKYGTLDLPRITMSFGVAAYPRHGMTAAELLASADAALYQAKRTGRNRICIAFPGA